MGSLQKEMLEYLSSRMSIKIPPNQYLRTAPNPDSCKPQGVELMPYAIVRGQVPDFTDIGTPVTLPVMASLEI